MRQYYSHSIVTPLEWCLIVLRLLLKMKLDNKKDRLIHLPLVENALSRFTTTKINESSVCIETPSEVHYYLTPSKIESINKVGTVLNLPYLLNNDATPWNEANLFLLDIAINSKKDRKGMISRVASHLLDYKIWIESEEMDYLDFSHKIKRLRPTFIYFNMLCEGEIGHKNINSRMSHIFKFYQYIKYSLNYEVDLTKVDSLTSATMTFTDRTGQIFRKPITKRELSLSGKQKSLVSIGYVRDEGEDLRPLTNEQTKMLLVALKSRKFSQSERLIFQFALDTGARKQSILTLRESHLQAFTKNNLQKNGCYSLNIGPGTRIDTKADLPHSLSIPSELAESLIIYIGSESYHRRKQKYLKQFDDIWDKDKDAYVFLSSRGGCLYMSKCDSRYPLLLNPPIGGSTQNVISRIFREIETGFPRSFSFHWLRATFAYRYYQFLLPLVNNRTISYVDQISFVQRAMGHKNRETTENYLKLFSGEDELLSMQECWEEQFFSNSVIHEMKGL